MYDLFDTAGNASFAFTIANIFLGNFIIMNLALAGRSHAPESQSYCIHKAGTQQLIDEAHTVWVGVRLTTDSLSRAFAVTRNLALWDGTCVCSDFRELSGDEGYEPREGPTASFGARKSHGGACGTEPARGYQAARRSKGRRLGCF
jgi:hypothetical protein